MQLIGIDCATNDVKVGLSIGEVLAERLIINDARVCTRERSAATTILEWVRTSDGVALLAIDTPMGWPIALGSTLSDHLAGQEIPIPRNTLFRRTTDRSIHERFGKTPLDVGADRIARTAHAALALLGNLRKALDATIPLAWSEKDLAGVSAIEVYPAATLRAYGLRSTEYKSPAQSAQRREMIAGLRSVATIRNGEEEMIRNAEREGWIWARTSEDRAHEAKHGVATDSGPSVRRVTHSLALAPSRLPI